MEGITIEGLWMKLILNPILIIVVDSISQDVFYSSWIWAVTIGLILAVLGYMLDLLLLRRGTLWISTILDFFVAAAVVFFSQFFIYNTFITMAGALLIASLLAIAEYYMHRRLIRSGRTEKAVE